MKTIKTQLIAIIVLIIIITACNKEETPQENVNKVPTCEISSPNDGQEFTQDESITISVNVEDSDGNITEVRFFIDGVGKGSANSFPYNYNWNTTGENTGSYTLKATSYDNDGSNSSDEISIKLNSGSGGTTGTFTDPRDGQTYATIEIGSQIWFAENINYEMGDSWWYNNSNANGAVYGRLYIWDAALNACPSGWHLPTDDEWKTMEMFLGMSQSEADNTGYRGTDEGEKMKSTSGWNSNGNGTNSSGFSAIPGGFRDRYDSFYHLGDYGFWWSSTENSSSSAWYRYLSCSYDQVYRHNWLKTTTRSVRCIKD